MMGQCYYGQVAKQMGVHRCGRMPGTCDVWDGLQCWCNTPCWCKMCNLCACAHACYIY